MSAGFEGNATFYFADGKAEGGTVIGMDVAVDSLATAFPGDPCAAGLRRFGPRNRPNGIVAGMRLSLARLAGETGLSAPWADGVYLKR